MKKNKENLLLRALIIVFISLAAVLAILLGVVFAIKPGNPIKTVIEYVQNGFKLDYDETDLPADITTDIGEDSTPTEDSKKDDGTSLKEDNGTSQPAEDTEKDTVQNGMTDSDAPTEDEQTEKEPVKDTEKLPEDTEFIPVTTSPSDEKPDKITSSVTTKPNIPTEPNDRVNDPDYFKDALFIGDSRTAGFYSHGNIEGATYFARTSMNVANCFNDSPAETGTGDYNLTELLQKYTYGKIYILLGINEIGYSTSWIESKYLQVITTIQKLQPNAIIIIQSNMHVTEAKVSIPDTPEKVNPFKNEKIDEVNARLAAFADNEKIFYLDTTTPFDDATGNLDTAYSRDGVHFNANGYKVWRDYILQYGKR